jgi:hypothetical protein
MSRTWLVLVSPTHPQELEAKARSSRVENWLHTGIVVKVMSKELAEHGYYKQKVSGLAAACTRPSSQVGWLYALWVSHLGTAYGWG